MRRQCRNSLMIAVVSGLVIAGCAPAGGGGRRSSGSGSGGTGADGGSSTGSPSTSAGGFKAVWETPTDPALQPTATWLEGTGLIEGLLTGINSGLAVPKEVPVTHGQCGEANAFWHPDVGVVMCLELIRHVSQVFAGSSLNLTEEQVGQATVNTWVFVLFHEIGHALVDLLELPVTGQEEDAVDDFSALLLVEGGIPGAAADAAIFWGLTSKEPTRAAFADEHSLDQQRFYNILCVVYGSNPDAYASWVPNLLPEDRAVKCPAEYEQKKNSWDALLTPHEK